MIDGQAGILSRRGAGSRGLGRGRAAATLAMAARATGGTAAVEFALSAPILLGLLVPIADLGMAFSQQHQVQQAVQAGAHYAASHPWHQGAATMISDAVKAASPLPGITVAPAPYQMCGCPNGGAVTAASCGSTCASSETAGYYVVVNAQLPYTPSLPYSVLGASTTLSARSTVRIR